MFDNIFLPIRYSLSATTTESRVRFATYLTKRMFREMNLAIEALKNERMKAFKKHETKMAELELYFDRTMCLTK